MEQKKSSKRWVATSESLLSVTETVLDSAPSSADSSSHPSSWVNSSHLSNEDTPESCSDVEPASPNKPEDFSEISFAGEDDASSSVASHGQGPDSTLNSTMDLGELAGTGLNYRQEVQMQLFLNGLKQRRYLPHDAFDIYAKNTFSNTCLHLAVKCRDVEAVRYILTCDGQGVLVRARNAYGATVMHHAGAAGRVDIIGTILQAAPDALGWLDDNTWTPLHWAAYMGQREAAAFIIEKAGVEIIATENKEGKNCIDIARKRNRKEMEALLRSYMPTYEPKRKSWLKGKVSSLFKSLGPKEPKPEDQLTATVELQSQEPGGPGGQWAEEDGVVGGQGDEGLRVPTVPQLPRRKMSSHLLFRVSSEADGQAIRAPEWFESSNVNDSTNVHRKVLENEESDALTNALRSSSGPDDKLDGEKWQEAIAQSQDPSQKCTTVSPPQRPFGHISTPGGSGPQPLSPSAPRSSPGTLTVSVPLRPQGGTV